MLVPPKQRQLTLSAKGFGSNVVKSVAVPPVWVGEVGSFLGGTSNVVVGGDLSPNPACPSD